MSTIVDHQTSYRQLKLFISHSHSDNTFCDTLVPDLRLAGFSVWFDRDDSAEGWLMSIISHALEEQDVFIPVLSPAFLSAPWSQVETNIAFSLQTHGRIAIIPVIAGAVAQLPSWAQALHYCDFTRNAYHVALAELRHVLLKVSSRKLDTNPPVNYADSPSSIHSEEWRRRLASPTTDERLDAIRNLLANATNATDSEVSLLEDLMFGDTDISVRRGAAVAVRMLTRDHTKFAPVVAL